MEKSDKRIIVAFTSILVVLYLGFYLYRVFALTDYNVTFAIYNGVKGSGKGSKETVVYQDKNGVYHESEVLIEARLKVGDTIWIKYSNYDPSIVEIVDLDYSNHYKKKIK